MARGPAAAFINKVLLEYSRAYVSQDGSFRVTGAGRGGGCSRDHVARKAENADLKKKKFTLEEKH